MKYYCYTKNSVIRLAFVTKLNLRLQNEAAKIYIKCKPETLKIAAMAYIPATSFKEFLVEIYRESHSYGKLIMMSLPAIHIS